MGCFDNLKKHVQDHREDLGTHQCVYQREILIGWLCSLCLFNGFHLIETISNVFLLQVLQSRVGHHHAVSFLETWKHLQNILEFCASKSCVQDIQSAIPQYCRSVFL
jgi:hypothetical protein